MRIFCRLLFFLILLSVPCVTMFSSCSPVPRRDDFSYATTPFSATVQGSFLPPDDPKGTPRPITATVTVGTPDPTTGERDMTVAFTQPASLAGVTVTAVHSNGTRTVTFTYPSAYGTVTSSSEAGDFDGFLRFAEALLPGGDVVEVSPVDQGGTHTIIRRTADGAGEAVYTFSSEQTLPLKVKVTDAHGVTELTVAPHS